jgi:hypothetical protein
MDSDGGRPGGLPAPVAAVTVLMAIQGGVAVLLGLVLAGRGRRIRRLGIGMSGARVRGAGVLLLLAGVVLIVVTVGLARLRPWARIGAFIIEGLSALSNLLRLGGPRPGAAVVGLLISGGVIAGLLSRAAGAAFGTAGAVGGHPPGGG